MTLHQHFRRLLFIGMFVDTTAHGRPVPESIFLTKEELPKENIPAKEAPKQQPAVFMIKLVGMMQTHAGQWSLWVNNERLIVPENKPLPLAHGVVIDKVENGYIGLKHKERRVRLYPGQTMTVDVGVEN